MARYQMLKPMLVHIDSRSLWLYVDGKEYFMSFEDFPWFADATVRQISNVERHGPEHFHLGEHRTPYGFVVDLEMHPLAP